VAVHRAVAGSGVDWLCKRPGHAEVIGHYAQSSKLDFRHNVFNRSLRSAVLLALRAKIEARKVYQVDDLPGGQRVH
jgi:hypothetical protein